MDKKFHWLYPSIGLQGVSPGLPYGKLVHPVKCGSRVPHLTGYTVPAFGTKNKRPARGPVFLVPKAGLEPARGHPSADFESAASAIPPLRRRAY